MTAQTSGHPDDVGPEPDYVDVELIDRPAPPPVGEQLIALQDFISEFGEGLLGAVQAQNPPIFDGTRTPAIDQVLDEMRRRPFDSQREVVHAITQLLHTGASPAGIINGEMGTGKTMMGIGVAASLHRLGFPRCLVLSPPHLVYKWRREIMQTVPNAKVWILNGADTLRKLLLFRNMHGKPANPEFFVLGRVRMRMGFNWVPAFSTRWIGLGEGSFQAHKRAACCSSCGTLINDNDGIPVDADAAKLLLGDRRMKCKHCSNTLWTLTRGQAPAKSVRELVTSALAQLPSIGPKTADRLIQVFGEGMLASMLEDNFHNFINLMDGDGELLFTDRQAKRMERYLGNHEISFGQGGYQPTEFIKRYLPKHFFGLMLVDEGHEYKNEGSAQGQAMGVLASQVRFGVLLTGTLMGGYADDLFHLLYRINPRQMIEDGYGYSARNTIGPAADAFMRHHGVLIETYKESTSSKSHKSARGETVTRHVSKGPGFGPKGIMRYVVPITSFIKLKDIGQDVLPSYDERFWPVPMDSHQRDAYDALFRTLNQALKSALVAGDHTLLGVVLNALLAWPDCAFRAEEVRHPRTRKVLAMVPALYSDQELMPKERQIVADVRSERQDGRRVLLYTTYTGTRDTTSRLKLLLEREGFKVAVLRASVEASQREDWVADQVERGIDVLITNPELVKTGLDLLEFPTIGFLQTGYNVYTLQQAARRSWRIGQKLPVKVHFYGYENTAQANCLTLMAKKIAVAQSTSGDMPESGLDVLNQDGDSIEVALARQLVG